MKKIALVLMTIFLTLTIAAPSFAQQRERKKNRSKTIQTEAGINIPEWGVAVDAFFDPRLTDLIPGYHIVNLVVTNHRQEQIRLDPRRDRWIIVDSIGKKHTARNHVKLFDKNLWNTLPEELKNKLDYPQNIKPGKFTTVDVFISNSVDLQNFREIIWKSSFFDKEFSIMTNYEKSLSLPSSDDKQYDIPENGRVQHYTDEDYLKTRDEVLNGSKKKDRWDLQDEEKVEENTMPSFDPSFDDAIIIR